MNITVKLDPPLRELMAAEARQLAAAIVPAVRETTEQSKRYLSSQIATRLTPRAGRLVESKFYTDRAAGYIHSRWWRRVSPRSDLLFYRTAKTVSRARVAAGVEARDVLAAHAFGARITAPPGRMLLLRFAKGPLRRVSELGRSFRQKTAGGRERYSLIPTARGTLIVLRFGKARGTPIGFLTRQVTIPQRLDLERVREFAGALLPRRLLERLARGGAGIER